MGKHSTATITASVKVVPLPTVAPALAPMPAQAAQYPELRYMGSKKRLLPWIHQVLDGLDFGTALGEIEEVRGDYASAHGLDEIGDATSAGEGVGTEGQPAE